MAKKSKKTKTTDGKKKENKTPTPRARTIPPGKPPKAIRMLKSLAQPRKAFTMGCVYLVPHDVPVPTARSWISSGVAEEAEI